MKVDNMSYKRYGVRIKNFFILDENNSYIVEIEAKFLNEEKVELKNFIMRKKEFLGKGYGSYLFKETINNLKEKGIKEIVLTACAMYKTKRLKQEKLISFYERNGFQKTKVKMNQEFLKENADKSYYLKRKIWKELLEKEVPMILKF